MPDHAAARALVMRHGWNAIAYQLLNPGIRHWFSATGDAVAGYVQVGHTRVLAGAPVCAEERLPAVVAEMERDAAAHGERLLHFAAGARLRRVIAGRGGHAIVDIGAQPTWDPRRWEAIVARKRSLRAQLHRAANKGVRVAEWTAVDGSGIARLRAVLHAWLTSRGLPPLGFLVTPDLLDALEDRRVFAAEQGEGAAAIVVAFLVATPVPARAGWLIEEWPRLPSAPNGSTHLLVDAAMRAFAASGAEYVSLGLAPLSTHGHGSAEPQAGQPAWLALAFRWLRAHGRRFYNFRGLEAFKAGMQPDAWEPMYAVMPGPRVTLRDLRAIAGAFSDGRPERLVLRALWSAVVAELRSLARRA